MNDLLELHLALDKIFFPIDSELAKDFNNDTLKHSLRFELDKRVIADKKTTEEINNLNTIWKITDYETKCKFVTEYIDFIEVNKFVSNDKKITRIEIAYLEIKRNKVNQILELQNKGFIDNVVGDGWNKSSISYMKTKEDAERYIDMLRERYNFKVFEFNDKESGHWFEEAFKFIVVKPRKAIEKYRCYELVLCD